MSYIAIDQCEHSGLYLVRARNFVLGIFNKDSGGFIGIREKFGREYPFEEYHYDKGSPFGTAFPIKLLEFCPKEIPLKEGFFTNDKYYENKTIFDWLDEKRKQYKDYTDDSVDFSPFRRLANPLPKENQNGD